MSRTPKFLYPRAREYAFDEVCDQIVRALEKRHFDVPGIKVEFDTYGSGEQWMRMAHRVTSQEFSLYFSRSQGLLADGVYNDTAAVNTVAIPGEQISVYGDNSGPSYNAYVGDDWERDREWFFQASCFVNSKLRGEPRRYLRYSGSDETGRQVRYGYGRAGNNFREMAKYLLHTNDIGREYDPGPNDEPFLVTSEVVDRMTDHLKDALKQIEAIPEREVAYQFEEEPDAPIEGCPEFWTYADNRAAAHIREGQSNAEELPAARRYALTCGYRLLSLDTPADGLGIDTDVLHDGYVWCALNVDEIPRNSRSSLGKNHLVRIKPTRSNDIYVVDEAAYDSCRAELSAKIDEENQDKSEDDKRTRFTDAEVNEMKRAQAKTLVPWNNYQGDFEKPVVLIGRELGFDEVQVIDSEAG